MRWNPEPTFSDLMNSFLENDWNTLAPRRNCCTPAANIVEKEDGFHLELSAPGMNKEDIKMEVENNVLTISAEKEEEKTEENKNFSRREFIYGSFSRSFVLPKSIDADAIKADYKNGILKVELPKKEEEKTKVKREITIG